MSVDLRKRIVDLSKKAAFAAHKHGIEGQRAQLGMKICWFFEGSCEIRRSGCDSARQAGWISV